MAYLGSTSRDRTPDGPVRPLPLPGAARRLDSAPYSRSGRSRRWSLPEPPDGTATFGAGLAVGLTLGAALALLFTPRSGDETRAALRRSAHRAGLRGRDAWDDLRDELRHAARRGKRHVGRAVRRGEWAAEDLIDGRRRRRRVRWGDDD